MSEKAWPCEHYRSSWDWIPDINYCPYCAAPRPKKPEKLWERIRNRYLSHNGCDKDSSCMMKNLADEAVKAFEEVIDAHDNEGPWELSFLKKRLQELL